MISNTKPSVYAYESEVWMCGEKTLSERAYMRTLKTQPAREQKERQMTTYDNEARTEPDPAPVISGAAPETQPEEEAVLASPLENLPDNIDPRDSYRQLKFQEGE